MPFHRRIVLKQFLITIFSCILFRSWIISRLFTIRI